MTTNTKKILLKLTAFFITYAALYGGFIYYIYREWRYNNLPVVVAVILTWVVLRFFNDGIEPKLKQARDTLEHEKELLEKAMDVLKEKKFTIKPGGKKH